MANTQNLDLVKPLGTDYALVSVLNSNSDKIDAYAGAVNASLDGLRDGLGILADGNTHAAVTSGQFVYVKNHQTLPQGLYQATTNIAANGTLSTSNLVADPKGGLNTLSEQIGTVNSNKLDRCTFTSQDSLPYAYNYTGGTTYTIQNDGWYFLKNQCNDQAGGKTLTIFVNNCRVAFIITSGTAQYEGASIFIYLKAGNVLKLTCGDSNVSCQLQLYKTE